MGWKGENGIRKEGKEGGRRREERRENLSRRASADAHLFS